MTTTHRTKIVATVGPASRAPAVLEQLVEAGVDVFRLNFSHGTHTQHSETVADIRAVSRRMAQQVAILQDLCGPKMRLEPLPGDVVECGLNDEFTLVTDAASTSPRELMCSYRQLPDDLKRGDTVLFADGTVAMTVIDTAPGRAHMKVTLPGRLRSRQGVNLPGSSLTVPSLTEKDRHDLDWTARHAGDIDFVGLSFVRSPADVAVLRQELHSRRVPAHVIVKIEKPQAVRQFGEIVETTDAVMVARGDLGVEMDVQRVPAIQKRIISLCNQAHRPVITATQMLNSMEHSNRPTRAEASDVFNAVVDGTDAVMLSGESAVGEYPVDAVSTMRRICNEAEMYRKAARPSPRGPSLSGFVDSVTEAAVDAACLMSQQLDAAMIVVGADSGRTAVALSNRRPDAIILALARTDSVARSLSLCWGVTAVVLPDQADAERVLAFGIGWAKSHRLLSTGQHAVLLRGDIAGREDIRAVLAGTVR